MPISQHKPSPTLQGIAMFKMLKQSQHALRSLFRFLSFDFRHDFFFINVQIDSSSMFLTITSTIRLSLVRFYWLKTLSCVFLLVSFQPFFFRFNFCSSPIFFLSTIAAFLSFCFVFFSSSIPFVGFSCPISPPTQFFIACISLATLSPSPHFFLLSSFSFSVSLSPITFSPSHLTSYPVFFFLSLSRERKSALLILPPIQCFFSCLCLKRENQPFSSYLLSSLFFFLSLSRERKSALLILPPIQSFFSCLCLKREKSALLILPPIQSFFSCLCLERENQPFSPSFLLSSHSFLAYPCDVGMSGCRNHRIGER